MDEEVKQALGYADPEDALFDPRGRTVRCTPRRRTVAGPVVGGRTLYRKFRRGGGALREWRMLHELADQGFRVPAPVCLARRGDRSVLVCLEVGGRPLDVLLAEAGRSGGRAPADYCVRHVAPLIRRLHGLGLFHRDLYLNHLYTADLDTPPGLIDVERTFRARWRRRRWIVKDLASLLSSAPPEVPRTAALRFLIAYLGSRRAPWKPLARACVAKAARIRAHRPKYG